MTRAERRSEQAFAACAVLLFALCAAATFTGYQRMSAMGGMPMPGGWTMSTAWMPMAGAAWPWAAASFLATWIVMMVAMMLPSLVPMLGRYRGAARRRGATRLAPLTAVAALGYFTAWAAVGVAAYPLGVAVAALAMQWPSLARAVPLGTGAIVVGAGALQFTAWKARQLARCRTACVEGGGRSPGLGTAWRHGLRLGGRCVACCAGPTAILLTAGSMDVSVMAVLGAAIAAERLAPAGAQIARLLGIVGVGTGSLLIARAIGLA